MVKDDEQGWTKDAVMPEVQDIRTPVWQDNNLRRPDGGDSIPDRGTPSDPETEQD